MEKLKQWLKAVVDAFLRGATGEPPPNEVGEPMEKALLVLRDVILFFVELLLTAAAIFTFIFVSHDWVRAILALAILISGMRAWVAAKQLRDILFSKES
jgi:hypothetical protein